MKNFGENDTIVAISTPPGEGGIGIIRISGENSGIVASKLFKCAKKDLTVENFESHKVVYGKIVDEKGNVIDEALCIAMWAPKFLYKRKCGGNSKSWWCISCSPYFRIGIAKWC